MVRPKNSLIKYRVQRRYGQAFSFPPPPSPPVPKPVPLEILHHPPVTGLNRASTKTMHPTRDDAYNGLRKTATRGNVLYKWSLTRYTTDVESRSLKTLTLQAQQNITQAFDQNVTFVTLRSWEKKLKRSVRLYSYSCGQIRRKYHKTLFENTTDPLVLLNLVYSTRKTIVLNYPVQSRKQ